MASGCSQLQTWPERDASTEWRKHCCLHKFPGNAAKWGCVTKRLAELEAARLESLSAVGTVSVCAETRGGIGAPRCAGTPVTGNRANIPRYWSAKRDNFDACPTCAGEEGRAAGHKGLRASNHGPACPESSSQLQSASLCFFYPPIKDSHTQTTPSCIKHFPAGPSSSCLL